ncbi:T6SS effector amidase Tae4 family protein [Telluria beijingensis]|uniref:T6SS effector amidase Tae4 family protein n=1 Tax=Telluria beijingensis TaxID=3068633 RepID=UPI0027958262|nr:T6SS effector amidase Tae4 family protein [Massilia sp. REN29]
MKPLFAVLNQHYPRHESKENLYRRIGWADVIQHPGFNDTCAIRMSVGLAGAGVPVRGAMKAKLGDLKNKRIEPRQANLSRMLRGLWGEPDIYASEQDARDGIANRSGVISFFRIGGGPGGHIDLISPGPYGFPQCARSCFFASEEIWFWPLQ